MRSRTAERLRLAVAARSYPEVQQLLTQYGGEVESQWSASSDEQRRLIAREASSLLEWTRQSILTARSHAQFRHVQFARQSAYAKVAATHSLVQLDA